MRHVHRVTTGRLREYCRKKGKEIIVRIWEKEKKRKENT